MTEIPSEMLHCLANTFQRLKSEVVDQHKGRIELEAMDDVVPLQIYMLAYSNIGQSMTLFGYMSDYLRFASCGFDLERKLLCNY
jgi:hypothetical protein